MERKAQAMDMKERKGMEENILLRDLPDLDDVPGVLNQVLLGENRPFGMARRSRGIDEHGRVVGASVLTGNSRGGGWK
jgi:hypothetical protein